VYLSHHDEKNNDSSHANVIFCFNIDIVDIKKQPQAKEFFHKETM